MKNKRRFFTNKGFTLAEVLVVIAVLSLLGMLILTIFTRTLRGDNKSQVILSIKQNGQSVIDQLDKIIRDADHVVCTDFQNQTIVLDKNGQYTRIKYTAPVITPSQHINGKIEEDSPKSPISNDSDYYLGTKDISKFTTLVCDDPIGTDSKGPVVALTDTDLQTGVSVIGGSFKRTQAAGFKDVINIELDIAPPIDAPSAVAGDIDPVVFKTTIQVR